MSFFKKRKNALAGLAIIAVFLFSPTASAFNGYNGILIDEDTTLVNREFDSGTYGWSIYYGTMYSVTSPVRSSGNAIRLYNYNGPAMMRQVVSSTQVEKIKGITQSRLQFTFFFYGEDAKAKIEWYAPSTGWRSETSDYFKPSTQGGIDNWAMASVVTPILPSDLSQVRVYMIVGNNLVGYNSGYVDDATLSILDSSQWSGLGYGKFVLNVITMEHSKSGGFYTADLAIGIGAERWQNYVIKTVTLRVEMMDQYQVCTWRLFGQCLEWKTATAIDGDLNTLRGTQSNSANRVVDPTVSQEQLDTTVSVASFALNTAVGVATIPVTAFGGLGGLAIGLAAGVVIDQVLNVYAHTVYDDQDANGGTDYSVQNVYDYYTSGSYSEVLASAVTKAAVASHLQFSYSDVTSNPQIKISATVEFGRIRYAGSGIYYITHAYTKTAFLLIEG